MKTLRIAFMGTPDFSVPALTALIEGPHEVVCVYTQPPRPAGRGGKIAKSSIHKTAEAAGIEVRHPKSLKKPDPQSDFADLDLDIAIVAAYGLILPQAILDAPKYGCLNIHASLLPRWRGAAPIQRSIMAGDDKTGICIMQMDAGLDTGDVIFERETPITDETTAQTLHDVLAQMGADMTGEVLDALAAGKPMPATPQTEDGMTYAKMLSRADGRIDWMQTAVEIERQLRALTPWPGVWCMVGDKRLKVHAADIAEGRGAPGEILDKNLTIACGEGALRLISVQPENKQRMDGVSYFNGADISVGAHLN